MAAKGAIEWLLGHEACVRLDWSHPKQVRLGPEQSEALLLPIVQHVKVCHGDIVAVEHPAQGLAKLCCLYLGRLMPTILGDPD